MTKMVKDAEQAEEDKYLFHEFPTPTFQQWREVVEITLKGSTMEERLVTNTYEGIQIQPMYWKKDIENFPHISSMPGDFPYIRGTNEGGYQEKPWDVCQRLDYSTPEEFNIAARNDLEKGQTMLHMVLNDARWFGPFADQKKINQKGVTISSLQDFQIAFQKINLEKIPVFFETGVGGFPFFASFMSYLQKQSLDLTKVKGCIGMDPLGHLVQTGTLPFSIDQSFEMMSEITHWSKKYAPQVQTIMACGRPYHEAGGNAVQELAFAIATGVEYIRQMEEQRIAIDDAAQRIRFSFSIGPNVFMEMAKFRAARLLWAQIVKEFGGNERSQRMSIHAQTSLWTKTKYDPYVNMLRGTVEAFGGIIGGVDSLCVSPFDEAFRQADEFSRRIARNTHLILEKEAHLGKVIDPAGGSWYIESLTLALAEKAWELFQRVEEMGGMFRALQAGFPQEAIARTADEKSENIKRKKHRFIGVNIYPNLSEHSIGNTRSIEQNKHKNQGLKSESDDLYLVYENTLVHSLFKKEALQDFISQNSIENAIQAADTGASIEELVEAIKLPVCKTPSVDPLSIHRGAEPFEDLREHSEIFKSRTGELPKVFVLNVGPESEHKNRTDFITEFFEVGGFNVIQAEGFHTINKAIKAFRDSNARIIVICSQEDNDPELVSSLARRIKIYNADLLVLLDVNPSPEDRSRYVQAGVDDFIHSEVNHYEKLLEFQMKGGVRECPK